MLRLPIDILKEERKKPKKKEKRKPLKKVVGIGMQGFCNKKFYCKREGL